MSEPSTTTDIAQASDLQLPDAEAIEGFSEDAATFEARRLASLQVLERFQRERSCAEESRPDEQPLANVAPECSDSSGSEEEEEDRGEHYEEKEEEYEEDDDDEPWVLDRILRRRVDKASREYQYLCQWKHGRSAPTWEEASVLEDEGFLGAVRSFDAAKAEANMPAKREKHYVSPKPPQLSSEQEAIQCTERPAPPPSAPQTLEEQSAAALKKLNYDTADRAAIMEQLQVIRATVVMPPDELYRNLIPKPSLLEEAVGLDRGIASLHKIFADCNLQITNYTPVAMSHLAERFMKTWEEHKATHRPMLLYHGTAPRNIPSIVEKGLLVPYTAPGIVHVHYNFWGKGIYGATSPNYWWGGPATYCHPLTGKPQNHREMFACVGLVCNKRYRGTMEILGSNRWAALFYDAKFIIPLWLIGFKFAHSAPTPDSMVKVPRRSFYGRFDQAPTLLPHLRILNQRPGDQSAKAQADADSAILREACGEDGGGVPEGYRGRPMTKRMLKEAPRKVKAAYKVGALARKKGRSMGPNM